MKRGSDKHIFLRTQGYKGAGWPEDLPNGSEGWLLKDSYQLRILAPAVTGQVSEPHHPHTLCMMVDKSEWSSLGVCGKTVTHLFNKYWLDVYYPLDIALTD